MADRRRVKRAPKPLSVRIDEILEEGETNRWSTSRLALLGALSVFLMLSGMYEDFRDPAAFVTVILALIGAVVAPKLLNLQVAIGSAAAAIGRKFTRREETVDTGNGSVTTTEAESTVTTEPAEPVEPEEPRARGE